MTGSPKRALVTGGCGFLGRPLVECLVARGFRVDVLDDLSVGREWRHACVRFYLCDISLQRSISTLAATFDYDVVYHLAALHYIPSCERDPRRAFEVNVVGTRNLLDLVEKSGARPRLVFASTMAVYPPVLEPIDEQVPVEPIDLYGWTKAVGEDLFRGFSRTNNCPVLLARLSNLVGTGETNPHLFPTIIEQLRRGCTLRLGNLDSVRNYIHVKDAARLLAEAAAIPLEGTEAINIGSQEELSVREVVDLFAERWGRSLRIEVDQQRRRAVDRPRLQPRIDRMLARLGPTRLSVADAVDDLLLCLRREEAACSVH